MIGLIKSELLKIRTTNAWWLFGIGLIVMTGLALLVNCAQADFFLDSPPPNTEGMNAEDARRELENYEQQRNVVGQAANIFTSGQFFGGLFVVLLGMLVVTNEFYHQTATATFLTTPRRPAVVVAKMVTGVVFGAVFWLVTTILSLIVGVIFFQAKNIPNNLGEWEVQRAILFNMMVFGLWAILGIGFGALIRNQIGAVVTGALAYVVGSQLAQIIFFLIREFLIKDDAVFAWMVVIPNTAANVFTSPVEIFPNSPPYWVGGLVLLGYGVVAAVIGTWIMRIRDIS
jgi:ABC-2 type transport system permease protein